ncbi:OmpH family outer membrane protein [Rhodocytophaga rosea]|uniref:OmpH family outer membrane protein n=1 Tax=Rhodocytophaga rosea TaxID=2704465 RepID=A0A6C0GPN1_9BACT|nr:OmpH family outer membrane protein [Rhodocytophaga rosea]QHT69542.1 OmpH family outer membrane protein [Rhodocytophaga rosea]
MKKAGMIFILCACIAQSTLAQKFGYIDTDFILSKMPDAAKAQSEIDAFVGKWQNDIQARYAEVDKLSQDYRAEEILLTDEMKQQRLKAIEDKKKEAIDYNNKIFGYEGMLFLKKKELMQPLRDQIDEAVNKVAKTRKLEFVFDKASDLTMIYSDPRHDYSDYVLEELGLAGEGQENKDTPGGNTPNTDAPKTSNPPGTKRTNPPGAPKR